MSTMLTDVVVGGGVEQQGPINVSSCSMTDSGHIKGALSVCVCVCRTVGFY